MLPPFAVHRIAFSLAIVVSLAFTIPGSEAGAQDKSPTKPDIVLKRRTETTDEDLRKQLQTADETGLDQGAADLLYAPIKKGGTKVKNLPHDLGPKFFAQVTTQLKRPDQLALPWRMGPDCEMGKEAAERLQVLSVKLRDSMRKSVQKDDIRPNADALRKSLDSSEWATPEALPTLTQMLQAENTPIRLLLVEMLGKIKGKEASIALAKRAIFDLSPEVREKAVRALAERPATEFTPVLHSGLRYPWAAAADHAAEAIVALQMTKLVPELVELLKEPSPARPVKKDKGYVVQEVMRINHLSNCMLCHAPSLSKDDLVRGRVPIPGEDPPPQYYQAQTGLFVRADLTYLRQDFSVVQPVANAGKWAGNQRYDYLVRTRQLTKNEEAAFLKLEKENKLPKKYEQQASVLFALRELAKTNLGDTYEEWSAGLPEIRKSLGIEKIESPGKDKDFPKP